MSSIDANPTSASAAHWEANKRRKAAWSAFAIAVIVTVTQVSFWHDWSFMWKSWVGFGGLGLYWLWLSSPRLGSARFEALVTKSAITAVPTALLLGVLVGALAKL